MTERKIQEKLIILNLSHGITGLLLKITKLVKTTCRRNGRIHFLRFSEK